MTATLDEPVHVAAEAPPSLLDRVLKMRELAILVVLVLMIVATQLDNSTFLSQQGIKDLLLNATILVLVAVGEAVVVITRNVDLSVGSVLGVAAFAAGDYMQGGGNPVVAVLIAIVVGAVFGVLNGLLVGIGQSEEVKTGGGATLTFTGSPSLSSPTLVLGSQDELPSALSIFLQGDQWILPAGFGDGLLCTGGSLKRLYIHAASHGSVSAPVGADPSIPARSAQLGDVLAAGAVRAYQVYYRDPHMLLCQVQGGGTWNVSSALRVAWN